MRAKRLFLKVCLSVLAGTVALGTFGLPLVERRSVWESFYFTIETITTVGFGDIQPATDAGRALTLVIILLGVGSFLACVPVAIEMMLERREEAARYHKRDVIAGVFMSDLGNALMSMLHAFKADTTSLPDLRVCGAWTEAHYAEAERRLEAFEYRVAMDRLDLPALNRLLRDKRELTLRLLENPALSEHESFTDLLHAVLHLADELAARPSFDGLPPADRLHLAGDVNRVQPLLVACWLSHMRHLQRNYPYLFSLAVRTNPFDPSASPIVAE